MTSASTHVCIQCSCCVFIDALGLVIRWSFWVFWSQNDTFKIVFIQVSSRCCLCVWAEGSQGWGWGWGGSSENPTWLGRCDQAVGRFKNPEMRWSLICQSCHFCLFGARFIYTSFLSLVCAQLLNSGGSLVLLLLSSSLFPPLPLTAPESGQSLPLNKTDRV